MNQPTRKNTLETSTPTPYASSHEHLTDLLARCSDLVAAHVARSPQGSRRHGVDRSELVERSTQRAFEDVPMEARQLWESADAKLSHIEAREAVTPIALPLRAMQRAFGLSAIEVDALMLAAAPQLDARYVAEWAQVDADIVRPDIRIVILPAALPLGADVDIERLALELELTGGTIKNAVLAAVQRCLVRGEVTVAMEELLQGARLQVRVPSSIEHHLYRPEQSLDDVVLTADLRGRIERFVAAARVRTTVLAEWGLGRTLGTGHGLVALFSGAPGTGKTFTAEAVAHALERPVLRCDVTSVISRWVGETAKQLEAVFEAARQHRAVIVFDEADALFARRVRVTTSTDRAFNGETAALLGTLDRFDGVVILTSNLADDIDPAFARRIQIRATFHAPDVVLRTALWRKLLGSDAPLAVDVDPKQLVQAFALTGAGIRSAILNAALEAASLAAGDRRITHAMLARAAAEQIGEAGDAGPRGVVGLA